MPSLVDPREKSVHGRIGLVAPKLAHAIDATNVIAAGLRIMFLARQLEPSTHLPGLTAWEHRQRKLQRLRVRKWLLIGWFAAAAAALLPTVSGARRSTEIAMPRAQFSAPALDGGEIIKFPDRIARDLAAVLDAAIPALVEPSKAAGTGGNVAAAATPRSAGANGSTYRSGKKEAVQAGPTASIFKPYSSSPFYAPHTER